MVGVWLGVEILCKAYLCHATTACEVSSLTLAQHRVNTHTSICEVSSLTPAQHNVNTHTSTGVMSCLWVKPRCGAMICKLMGW